MTEPAIGLVMAGGLGTRMRASNPVPKPLVEVAGVPLLELALRRLVASGVRDIRVAVRHEAERLCTFLARLQPTLGGARVQALVEEQPLGTIGAAYHLRGERATVLVTNGDLLSAIDLGELLVRHRESQAHLTIATHDEHHRLKLGEVVTAVDGRVLDYLEKPVKSWRISSGTYALEPDVLALIEAPGWLGFPALVRRALDARLCVREFHHDRPWLDVNDAQDLARAEEMVAQDPAAFGLPEPGQAGFSSP
jgi:NDP-sugar pyrophosphorylase family protein